MNIKSILKCKRNSFTFLHYNFNTFSGGINCFKNNVFTGGYGKTILWIVHFSGGKTHSSHKYVH
jgi:hypothetical protein